MTARSIALVLLTSVGLHVSFLVLSATVLSSWRWAHEPFHAVVEALGAFVALAMVPLLLSLERRGEGTSHNLAIASGLAGMGVLDGLHAAVHVGDLFVWLHSIATLVGGALLALCWLPRGHFAGRLRPWLVAAGAAGIGALSIAVQDSLPAMTADGGFTATAKALNIVGGVLLLAAAARLLQAWRRSDNVDDLLFVLHCGLFGAAAIMFEQSHLWDLAWWGWHVLRLLAYAVALLYVVLSLRRNERAVAQARALERINAELERFAYVTAHDLREPARSAASMAQLALEEKGGALDAEGREWLEIIAGDSARMLALIDDLLALSRIEIDAAQFEPVALTSVAESAVKRLALAIGERGAELDIGPLPTVRGSQVQLEQLLQNLIGNAIKFCDERPLVRVRSTDADESWRITVEDNGIGIPPQHRERALEVFARLVPRSRYPGSGVGLAICQRIVEHHGGRIAIEAADDPPYTGCRIAIHLPCYDVMQPSVSEGVQP